MSSLEDDRHTVRFQAGAPGWLFGLHDHARVNIAGLIALLALTGELALFFSQNQFAEEFVTATTPVITLALGYIFGRGVRGTST